MGVELTETSSCVTLVCWFLDQGGGSRDGKRSRITPWGPSPCDVGVGCSSWAQVLGHPAEAQGTLRGRVSGYTPLWSNPVGSPNKADLLSLAGEGPALGAEQDEAFCSLYEPPRAKRAHHQPQ